MKKILSISALLLSMSGVAEAQSINIALDTTPDRDKSGTYRYADDLMTSLKAQGWETEAFPVGTIGGEDERLDQVRSGILDVSLSKYSVAVQFVPEMQALQLPYTFQNPNHEFKFFTESGYLDTVNKTLAAEGMRILAVVPVGGSLGIFNDKREIKSVADMKGMRLRALDPNQVTMFEMMGANGVVIPFSEVPNAIQTGIADGYVNAASVPLAFGQTDLFSHFTDAKIFMSARLVLVSESWWNDLSDEEKAQLKDASYQAQKAVFEWLEVAVTQQKAELNEKGVAVYEPSDAELASFKEATKGMAKLLQDIPQERIAELQAMVDQYAP